MYFLLLLCQSNGNKFTTEGWTAWGPKNKRQLLFCVPPALTVMWPFLELWPSFAKLSFQSCRAIFYSVPKMGLLMSCCCSESWYLLQFTLISKAKTPRLWKALCFRHVSFGNNLNVLRRIELFSPPNKLLFLLSELMLWGGWLATRLFSLPVWDVLILCSILPPELLSSSVLVYFFVDGGKCSL